MSIKLALELHQSIKNPALSGVSQGCRAGITRLFRVFSVYQCRLITELDYLFERKIVNQATALKGFDITYYQSNRLIVNPKKITYFLAKFFLRK